MSPAEQLARMALRQHLNAFDAAMHLARRVRALSFRVPMVVRIGNRGFQYSISGWHGAI